MTHFAEGAALGTSELGVAAYDADVGYAPCLIRLVAAPYECSVPRAHADGPPRSTRFTRRDEA
jgi:hypothetical protein